MKIGTITPTIGRPNFLSQCKKYIESQTVVPDFIEIIDFENTGDVDLTLRYRIGCEKLLDKGVDVIFFIEDDDFYSNVYIEKMLSCWSRWGKPEIIGSDKTTYYHLELKKYVTMPHTNRSSMFSTMITSEAAKKIKWPSDDTISLDMKLWRQLKGHLVRMQSNICLGIKHGLGVCGGKGHSSSFVLYRIGNSDKDYDYLCRTVGEENIEFYKNIISTREP